MYRAPDPAQLYLEDFKLQFGGKLRADNRWVVLSKQMPWERIEEIYARNFSPNSGAEAINSRIAFGAIYAKEHEEWTDRETVQNTLENPYFQYFLGFKEFQEKPPFDASMMVYFRKRFSPEAINEINELIFLSIAREADERNGSKSSDSDSNDPPVGGSGGNDIAQAPSNPQNKGKLIIDATCAPADIRYPTDLSLLNEARENTEEIIDIMCSSGKKQGRRQAYNRKKARGEYLSIIKQKRPKPGKIRAAIAKQLEYLWKNIEKIGDLMLGGGYDILKEKHLRRILTVCELYRQQLYMWQNRTHKCDNRIVSLRQPHVRPIVRGKAGKKYEFGQKLAVSVVGGYTFVEKQSFESFNEGIHLIESIERYKQRFGFYTKAVLADQIYRNRSNRNYCKQHGIRLSGPKLGQRKMDDEADDLQTYKDLCERNIVESRIGISKRRFGLDLIMCYLPETALTEAALQVLCTNLSLWLKFLFDFLKMLFQFLKMFFYDFSWPVFSI